MRGTSRLYRDKPNGKISGVCAGVAEYLGWDVTAVRIGWIVATIFWAPVMIGAYVLMSWLLNPKPDAASIGAAWAQTPMPSDPTAPRHRFAEVKARFDRLEAKLRAMETVVTSREFQMDRELRGSQPR